MVTNQEMMKQGIAIELFSWFLGVVVFLIGILNILWGNDQAFGACMLVFSFAYFPPANTMLKELTNIAIPGWLKILLGIAILVGALGVGELFGKIDLMINSFVTTAPHSDEDIQALVSLPYFFLLA